MGLLPSFRLKGKGLTTLEPIHRNKYPEPDRSNLSEVEQPAKSETPAIVEPQDKTASRPLDRWSKTVMDNMKRMATDEDYRKSIAQKLS